MLHRFYRSFNHLGIQLSFNISNCVEMSRRHTGLQGRAETVPIIKLPYFIQGFESQFDLFVERRQLFEKLKLSKGGEKKIWKSKTTI